MTGSKADIITRLKRDILSLQGLKGTLRNTATDNGLGIINNAFPNNLFPAGAVHEFIAAGAEDAAATSGFIGGILSSLMNTRGACIWICCSRSIFPPALTSFGIAPDKIIFIDLKKQKELLWVLEEALKCSGLSAVIAEVPALSFTASRRLQLAVEQSQVTGFILRNNSRFINTTTCITRWKITSLPSEMPGNMPGVGFPRWNVELLKVRNGTAGKWQIEYRAGCFRHISKYSAIALTPQKKTG